MNKKLQAALKALSDAESFISGFEDDETQEGVSELLQRITAILAEPQLEDNPRVLVTVSGGVAEVQTHGEVDFDIIDFDNLEAEGLDYDQREAEYQAGLRWLWTGTPMPQREDDEDGEDDIIPPGPVSL